MSFDEEHLDDHHLCRQEVSALEAERDALKAELERVKAERYKAQMREAEISSAYMDPKSYINELESKLERLSGKTGFCTLCEGYAKKLEIAREALKEAVTLIQNEYCSHPNPCNPLELRCYASKQLDALARMEGK